AWMAIEGAKGFDIAGWGVTLVLRASWFKRSSCSHAKELAAIRVYGCHAFTSSCSHAKEIAAIRVYGCHAFTSPRILVSPTLSPQ
ncbi:hypothetical protein B296_00054336, partial [Ensete ventricosum]